MKKILAVMMSLIMALSFFSLAFAADSKPVSKTEKFVQSMENGVGVGVNMDFINGELYVKKDKAVANVSIGSIDAKAILDDGKFTAYFGIFNANITELVGRLTIKKIESIVNEVPNAFKKFDTEDYFKYLTVKETKTENGCFFEIFGPDYEEIAKLITAENPTLNLRDVQDMKAFCEYYSNTSTFIASLLNASATFKYEDENAVTLKAAEIKFPNDHDVLETIDVFSVLKTDIGGVTIDFITVDIQDKVFDKPFSILNITWIIKLIKWLA